MLRNNAVTPLSVFDALYNKTEKVISFNKFWHASAGKLTNAILHTDYRLILDQAEFAKCLDNFGRKVIFLGSHYGLIVLYQELAGTTRKQRIAYEVCPMLVSKGIFVKAFDHASVQLLQHLADTTEHGLIEQINNGALQDKADGIRVWDGIKKPELKKHNKKHITKTVGPDKRRKHPTEALVEKSMKEGAPVGQWLAEGNKRNHQAQASPNGRAVIPPKVNTEGKDLGELVKERVFGQNSMQLTGEAQAAPTVVKEHRPFAGKLIMEGSPEAMGTPVPVQVVVEKDTDKGECKNCGACECEMNPEKDVFPEGGWPVGTVAVLAADYPPLPEGVASKEVLGSGAVVIGFDPAKEGSDQSVMVEITKEGPTLVHRIM